MGQSVYLAGKIAQSDWRHAVVDGLDDACSELWTAADAFAWPRLPGAIFGAFDYVGPYFVGEGHGCAHGERSHGVGLAMVFGHASAARLRQDRCAKACLESLRRADVVFSWLDDSTAHGTLIELGYAMAVPGARRVIVARPSSLEPVTWGGHGDYYNNDDLWFASALPGVEHVRGPDPITVLRSVLVEPEPAFESPAERAFWVAWQAVSGPELALQHRVFGGQYRLDFAHLASRTAIEIDGLAYHNGQEAFRKDHERQRRLTQAGWRVVRFTAKEVLTAGQRCAREAVALCGSNGSNGRFE